MKKVEEFLIFCDEHLKEMRYIIVTLIIISEIMFNFFHTSDFGYIHATAEENILSTMLTVIIYVSLLKNQKVFTKVQGKRDTTYANLILLAAAIFNFLSNFYCMFIGDISIIIVLLVYIPLFIALVAWLYKIRSLLKKAINIIILNIKLYINLGKK